VAVAAGPLMRGLAALGDRIPVDTAVPSHGTFRPAQVLLRGDRVGFIDFDGSCMAEPAYDIGRFRATLRDIAISAPAPTGRELEKHAFEDRMTIVDELCEEFLDRYRQQAPINRQRVMLWEVADLFTLLLHAWTKVRLTRVAPRLSLLSHYLDTERSAAAGWLGGEGLQWLPA
jgi:Ser/Thr protein kinase RdoA (MazF antagonist)